MEMADLLQAHTVEDSIRFEGVTTQLNRIEVTNLRRNEDVNARLDRLESRMVRVVMTAAAVVAGLEPLVRFISVAVRDGWWGG